MTCWRDEIAKMSPAEIRERNRAVYRLEVGQPGMKWRMFQEQCRKLQRRQASVEHKSTQQTKKKSTMVTAILKRLRYMTDRRVKQRGGTAHSNLHAIFLHWDKTKRGVLSVETLVGSLSQLGVPISSQEAKEIVAHYSTKDPAEGEAEHFPYKDLLCDALDGAPGLLEGGPSVSGRLLGSSRSEGSLMGTSKPPKERTPTVRAFCAKLQEVIEKRVRDSGGTPHRVLRSLLLNWDTDDRGTLSMERLRGALRSLNVRISATQAKAITSYYAKDSCPDGECEYMSIVRDVCGDNPGLFHIGVTQRHSESAPASERRKADYQESGTSSHRSSQAGSNLNFTARPRVKPPNRVVERFKLKLRNELEKTIKERGGVNHAIIREAFLKWDADASGSLDPRELMGALRQMNVRITEAEAVVTVNYYDLAGNGEMDYRLLCKEIKAMSHPILSYIEEVDVLNGLTQTVREPDGVKGSLDRIRAGVIYAGRRAVGSSSKVPPISARDLLMGTCLRFDHQGSGTLGADKLMQVWRELKVNLRRCETTSLIAWLDRRATGEVKTSDLCNSVFCRGCDGKSSGSDAGSSSSSSRQKDQPIFAYPKPRVMQAQRSVALAMGKSSHAIDDATSLTACPPLPPGRADVHTNQPALPCFTNSQVWNWQSRALDAATLPERTAHRNLGDGNAEARANPANTSAVNTTKRKALRASGEAVIAEKARIQRRLKELQRERDGVLREKRGFECWGERAGEGRRRSARTNECAA